VRRSIPFLRLYRKATVEEAEQAFRSGRTSPVRAEFQAAKISLQSLEAAEVLASVPADEVSLSGLEQLEREQREACLLGLRDHSVSSRQENLKRMAQNTISSGDWAHQLAQLQHRDSLQLLNKRSDGLNGRIPDAAELESLSEELDETRIDFGFLKDGCYARGHLLCGVLREHGINSAKVFVEGDLGIEKAKTVVTADGLEKKTQHWKFHTAPLLMVEEAEGQPAKPRIWDPTMAKFEERSTAFYAPTDWLARFDQGGDIKFTIHDDTRYLPNEFWSNSFEENLETSKRVIRGNNISAAFERSKNDEEFIRMMAS
jgi:hypothetical protein